MPDITVESIAQDLHGIAAGRNRNFTSDGPDPLDAIIRDAAEEIVDPRRFGERSAQAAKESLSERRETARRAMERLVERLNRDTAIPPHDLNAESAEEALKRAMSDDFCPCWPFC